VTRPRIGTVLVWTFGLLLVALVAHRAFAISDAAARVGPDRAIFARIARPLPGQFARVKITHDKTHDIACARHRRPHPYKLCVTIQNGRALHVHRTPLP
jgi:hypothetical protein